MYGGYRTVKNDSYWDAYKNKEKSAVSGFVYVVNVLDLLKNRFGQEQASDDFIKMHLRLFLVVCQTLSAAMRFEPANAKYFQNEGQDGQNRGSNPMRAVPPYAGLAILLRS
uniref:Uncharacterized protein n=1 Tax=Anopheles culicifacies TaxID=139723 RepID=A0A182MPI9_9DIPT